MQSQAGAAAASAYLHRRHRRAAYLRTAARFAQHWNFPGGTLEQSARARDALHKHCADLGRAPAGILLSSQVRFTGDPAGTAAAAAAPGGAAPSW